GSPPERSHRRARRRFRRRRPRPPRRSAPRSRTRLPSASVLVPGVPGGRVPGGGVPCRRVPRRRVPGGRVPLGRLRGLRAEARGLLALEPELGGVEAGTGAARNTAERRR